MRGLGLVIRMFGLSVVIWVACCLNTHAAKNWDGSESSDWSDPGNWAENAIPNNEDVYLSEIGNPPTNQDIAGLEIQDLWFDTNFTSGITIDGEAFALDDIRTPDGGSHTAHHKILCDLTLTKFMYCYIQDNITMELAGDVGDDGNGYGIQQNTSHGTLILSGNNTYGGKTQAHLGTLKFRGEESLGTPPATPTVDWLVQSFGTGPWLIPADGEGYNKVTINANRGVRKGLRMDGKCEVSYGGAISPGQNFTVVFDTSDNTGILRLSGTSTFDDNLNFSEQGLVILESANALGSTNGYTQTASATLDLNGFDTDEPLTQYGAGVDDRGNYVNMNLDDTSVLAGPATTDWDYSSSFFGGRGDILMEGDVLEDQSGGINGPRRFYKIGSGALTLRGSNDWSGATGFLAGRVVLDRTSDNSVKFGNSTQLLLSNCGLTLLGNDSQPSMETITQLFCINDPRGASYIAVVAGDADATFSFDDFYQNNTTHPYYQEGRPLDFRTSSTGTGTARIIGRSVQNEATSGILSTCMTYDYGRTWAMVDANSNIVGLADGAYVNTMTAAAHIDVPAGTLSLSANTSVESLRFDDANAMTVDCNGNTLELTQRRRTYGMIMTPDAGADAEISGGTLKGTGYNSYMMAHQYNTNHTLTISAQIVDTVNMGFCKAGPGEVILNNDANNFDAATCVLEGTLTFTSAADVLSESALGRGENNSTIVIGNDATLKYIGSGHSTDRPVDLRGTATIEAAGSGTLQFSEAGDVITSSSGDHTLILTGGGDGQIDGAIATGILGGLFKRGTGTWTLNGTNTYRWTTEIEAGTLELNGAIRGDVEIDTGGTLRTGGATLKRNLDIDGTLEYVLSGASAPLHVQGEVTLGGTLAVDKLGGPGEAVLLTSDYPLIGSFDNLPSDFDVEQTTYSVSISVPQGTVIQVR